METYTVEKFYLVFEIAYRSLEQAKRALAGWEHKEPIYEVYLGFEDEIPNQVLRSDMHLFDNETHAMEHLQEWFGMELEQIQLKTDKPKIKPNGQLL